MEPTTEPKYRDRLREEILQLADRLLATEGLDALQARRIAREADCSVGTIYNIFGDIDGLIVAANSRTLIAMGQSLRQSLDAAGSLPAWLPTRPVAPLTRIRSSEVICTRKA